MVSKEITLNGHKLTAEDGILYLDGNVIGFTPNKGNVLTVEQAKKLFHSKSENFINEQDFEDAIKSKDIDGIKDEILSQVDVINGNAVQDEKIQNLEVSFKKLNRKFEALIEAFDGKPQKLNRLRKK